MGRHIVSMSLLKSRIVLTIPPRYPVVYCVIILPLSGARWTAFIQGRVSPTATFVGVAIFGLSGVLDAVTYFVTRTKLFKPARVDGQAPDLAANAEKQSETPSASSSIAP